ncbi:acyl-CoA oxidase [Kitasatospora sp. MMS16-BH015]|uniref:acyl-CoA dehydrogenase family protein n=1 Tax=Kitasatospora sp. MMS16-BH015 TaxID=2018025 RepID=UPI000CA0D273|nr:acyl-CoA dehydrogenase [Kitasatospora sp. MMS16-BH015]AUG80941.1 acyl-CoA oxidase [Kitasatospora sp. MMS16-BH015]
MITETKIPEISETSDLTVRALTRVLYGEDAAHHHERWRKLVSTPPFRQQAELARADRLDLSYQRLRLIAEATEDGERLAADPVALAALHEWTALVDGGLTTVAGIHYNLFLGSLVDHDGGRDLTEYTELRRTGTFLCTELEHGNDAAALETTATYRPEDRTFLLHTPRSGAQKFMPNTSLNGGPKSAVVAARLLVGGTDHGVFLFLTPLTDGTATLPGVRVRPLPERVGSPVDHCLTSFDRVVLPLSALLTGEHGRLAPDGTLTSTLGNKRKRFLAAIGRVTTGKLCMSAAALGATRKALTIAVRYGHTRQVSGSTPGHRLPVFAHRSHYAPLVGALATTYAMTLLHRSVLRGWAERPAGDPAAAATAERLTAVAKGWITWQARAIGTECRERCGAQGLLAVNGVAGLVTDLEGTITAEGDNLVIWAKAGAELLFQHTPEEPPATAGRDLSDPATLLDLLAAVEHLWLTRARTRLRQGPSGDPLARWNHAVTPALRLVEAHAQLLAARELARAAEADAAADDVADDSGRAAEPLRELLRLFALQRIAEQSGDLLALGRLTPEQVLDLPVLIDGLTERLAAQAMPLTAAFDLPTELLADHPIARTDYTGAYDDPEGHWH